MRLRFWRKRGTEGGQPEQEGHGVADALGLGPVLHDPDGDADEHYEDRTDGELHWAETNPDKPGPMP